MTHHYDLGNEFYRLWLGDAMVYSCAYFKSVDDTIDVAQAQKLKHICEKLQLAEGQTVLDIGCGWGGFAIYAAMHYAVKVVGVTLSEPQAQIARERVTANGLGDQVRIEVRDYRDLRPARPFDRIVSIGMLEHVGSKGYQEYFRCNQRLLANSGIGILHTIGRTVRAPEDPWIRKHIFPGLHLPTLAEIAPPMGLHQLKITDIEVLRMHYALTLDRWAEAFERNGDAIRSIYGEAFVRKWRFYLRGCAASFRYGDCCLFQIQFTRGLKNDLPLTRDYLYRPVGEELVKKNGDPG